MRSAGRATSGRRASVRWVVVIAFVLAGLSGCFRGGAPSNGMLHIVNLGRSGTFIHWQGPGLFGSAVLGASGTEPVAACQEYVRGFPPDPQQITITSETDTVTFTLDAPVDGQLVVWYVIEAGGHIAAANDDVPSSPFCPSQAP